MQRAQRFGSCCARGRALSAPFAAPQRCVYSCAFVVSASQGLVSPPSSQTLSQTLSNSAIFDKFATKFATKTPKSKLLGQALNLGRQENCSFPFGLVNRKLKRLQNYWLSVDANLWYAPQRMDSRQLVDGLIMYLGMLVLLTFHEFGHAWMAWRCGDTTARDQGRVSLNPLVHIDLIGTVILPLIMILSPGVGRFLIGWAKPVPVNPHNLRNPRVDDILVTLAGPWMNLLLAVVIMGLADRMRVCCLGIIANAVAENEVGALVEFILFLVSRIGFQSSPI